jgi:nickel/cobalt transporter (NicO) family protein
MCLFSPRFPPKNGTCIPILHVLNKNCFSTVLRCEIRIGHHAAVFSGQRLAVVSCEHITFAWWMISVRNLPDLFLKLQQWIGLAFGLLLVSVLGAIAHPHVFVEARSALVFDDNGQAVAVNHVFRFDDAFTAFAIQGFDKNLDGIYSREELSELADVNIESMADFGYFTFGDNTRIEFDFGAPTDYWLEVATVPLEEYWVMKPEDYEAIQEDVRMNGGEALKSVDLLELHFTLPLKDPSDAANAITLDVYDPTYYVDFRFGREDGAVGTVNAPGACTVSRNEPPALDDATAYALSQIGPDQRDLPPELRSAAESQVNQMIVNCAVAGVGPVAKAGPGVQIEASADGNTQDTKNAGAVDSSRSDSVVSSTRETVAVIGPNVGAGIETGFFDRIFGTIARKQKEFSQALKVQLRLLRNNPNAGWLLMGLSFAYGVFHAAGPGHGKAIITSYVIADNETLRKGIILSFASAFAQAVTAIVLIGVLAVVLNKTSNSINDTTKWLEIGSYVLITALGGWLLWRKALHPLVVNLGSRSSTGQLAFAGHSHSDQNHGHGHAHHDHHHHEIGPDGVCSSCGHAHAPTPDMLQGKITLARAVSIVLAVGLRPCTGALIVLVTSLSLDMFGVGVASTFAMAVGTGITVALLASLAVGSKELAVRLFGEGSPMSLAVHRFIEIAGALLVFLLGLTLLIAALGWR